MGGSNVIGEGCSFDPINDFAVIMIAPSEDHRTEIPVRTYSWRKISRSMILFAWPLYVVRLTPFSLGLCKRWVICIILVGKYPPFINVEVGTQKSTKKA